MYPFPRSSRAALAHRAGRRAGPSLFCSFAQSAFHRTFHACLCGERNEHLPRVGSGVLITVCLFATENVCFYLQLDLKKARAEGDRMKHGSGIKDRDDRSSGIEIRIADGLVKINPTDPLILGKEAE